MTGEPDIGDLGLVADGHAAALISRDAAVEWCCLPRMDSASVFGRLLDPAAGHLSLTPTGPVVGRSRRYLDRTMVLETTIETETGRVRILHAMAAQPVEDADRRLLVVVEGVDGEVELDVEVAIRFDYGEVRPWIRRHTDRCWSAVGGSHALLITCDEQLEATKPHDVGGRLRVPAGRRVHLSLAPTDPIDVIEHARRQPEPAELDRVLDAVVERWRRWSDAIRWDGPDELSPVRSAIVLKSLADPVTGAIAAAPTTSLPEVLGGKRNWDYRASWIRDSQFTTRALATLGCDDEASRFARFVERSAAGNADELQIMFGLGGERRLPELELDLEGYCGSRPVRVGNGAAGQRQHDALGELLDLAWRWHQRGHTPDDEYWYFLTSLVDAAADRWEEPDCGIWELRGPPRQLVHSKVMCWVAIDRGIRLAEAAGRSAPLERWRAARDRIRATVLERGVDHDRGTFVQQYDHPETDAALLLIPTTGFVAPDDPLVAGTVAAVVAELGDGGLLRRYDNEDHLEGREGAFLACSFWLAECLAGMGRIDEAREAFARTAATANDLGLYSEEHDVAGGRPLGNFPQALTHLSHVVAAVAIAEAERGGIEEPTLG